MMPRPVPFDEAHALALHRTRDDRGGRAGGFGLELLEGVGDLVSVVAVDLHRVPAKRLPLALEIANGEDLIGRPVEIDDRREIAEAQVGTDERALPDRALVALAVAHERE